LCSRKGAPQRGALCVDATSCHSTRSSQETSPAVPSGTSLPREKVAALSLCSSFRESKHLQLLRLQVKETCKHESRTQAKKQIFLLSATHPSSTKFQAKTILLSPPATKTGCRGASPYRERKNFFFLRLPRVMAKRREMQNKLLCFSRLLPCSAARNEVEDDSLLAIGSGSLIR